MALYSPEFSILKSAQMIRLTGFERQPVVIADDWMKSGAIFFTIEISVDLFTWQVKRRYSEFHRLHAELSRIYDLSNVHFPSKKSMYIQNEAFIKQRQNDLEVYLLTVVHKLGALPKLLADFLDFGQYEINSICDTLAIRLNALAMEKMVKSEEAFAISPLELHAVCERLKLPATSPLSTANMANSSGAVESMQDSSMATILEFLVAVKFLKVEGSDSPVGSSNVVPNRLSFDLAPFKSVRTLVITNSDADNITGFFSVLDGLAHLHVHKTLTAISSFLPRQLAKRSNKSLTSIDFANNAITEIDESLQAFSSLVYLDLSFNQISVIEHLEHCTRLQHVNLSHNCITSLENFNRHVGNVKTLDLSYNMISSLEGIGSCGMEVFDISSNRIDAISGVKELSLLPLLRSVNLNGNPVERIVDYRVKMLLLFGDRSAEVTVDNLPPLQDELDRVSVLLALQQANLDVTSSAGQSASSPNPLPSTLSNRRCSGHSDNDLPTMDSNKEHDDSVE